jgi:hypothetical protein
MAIVDLTAVKTLLSIDSTDTSQDAMLDLLIGYADGAVKSFCLRDFEQTTYPGAAENGTGDSGYYDGDNQRRILLRQRPVITTGLTVYLDMEGRFDENPDGSFVSATQLVYGTDYTLRLDGCLPMTTTKCSYSGILERVRGIWPAVRRWTAGNITPRIVDEPGSIRVAYTGGWPDGTVPMDVQGAVVQLVAQMRKNIPAGGQLQGEGLGAYNYSFASVILNTLPELGTVRSALGRYRETRLFA